MAKQILSWTFRAQQPLKQILYVLCSARLNKRTELVEMGWLSKTAAVNNLFIFSTSRFWADSPFLHIIESYSWYSSVNYSAVKQAHHY